MAQWMPDWNLEKKTEWGSQQPGVKFRMSINQVVRNNYKDGCTLPPFQRMRVCCYTSTASSHPCRWDLSSPSSISSSVVASVISGITTSPFGDSVPDWSLLGIGSPNSATMASWRLRTAARKLPREIEGTLPELLELGCACVLWRSRWNRHMRMTDKLRSLSLMTVMQPD